MKLIFSTLACCCCFIPLFILGSVINCELDSPPTAKALRQTNDATTTNITVTQPLIFYTAAPIRIVRPIIKSQINFANRVYLNNSIPIKLSLTRIIPVQYDSADSYANLMYATTLRHRRASIVVFISQLMLACGRTFLDCKDWSSCGFAVVKFQCINDLSLLHELGHLHGANHNKPYVWPNSNPYHDAYGTVVPGVSKTIMAYGNERRVPLFSNSGDENNRRVIIANRFNFKR